MNKTLIVLGIFFLGCNSTTKREEKKREKKEEGNNADYDNSVLYSRKSLPKKLKEISGQVTDGNAIWAICDNPKSAIYKLDTAGNVLQQVVVSNIAATDVEAITADENYLYIGDIGDNDGSRNERIVMKIKKSAIGKSESEVVTAEKITFYFPDEVEVKKKKKNNYDAEAMLSYKDSLYVFTKRRGDDNTELMVIAKTPGNAVARPAGVFNSKGLVTDAAINSNGSEIALIGYEDGHQSPFIWLLSNFTGADFFSGSAKEYQLADRKVDWQTEGITFYNNNILVFSCEETKDIPFHVFLCRNENLICCRNKKRCYCVLLN